MEGRQMNRHKIRNLAPLLLLAVLLVARPGGAEETERTRSLTNLRGDVVIVPDVVPDRETLVLLGMQIVRIETPVGKSGMILAFYNNPKSQGLTNYVETYDLSGNLLEITWSDEEGKVKVAKDKNLTSPDAKAPAKVLVMDADDKPSVEQPARLHF